MAEEPRSASEQMADLHVYLMPSGLWREQQQTVANQFISDCVSLGFIRIHPELRLCDLRGEISEQLQDEGVPESYLFLRSVGRCLAQVRPQQEMQIKVKNFLPPRAYAPEIFLLEAMANRDDYELSQSPVLSVRGDQSVHSYPGGAPQNYNFRRRDTTAGESVYSLPPIGQSHISPRRGNGYGAPHLTKKQPAWQSDQNGSLNNRGNPNQYRKDRLSVNGADFEATSPASERRYDRSPRDQIPIDDEKGFDPVRERKIRAIERAKAELEISRNERGQLEKQREELIILAKSLQARMQETRANNREEWKRKFYEEKKKSGPLEEQISRFKHELDSIQRKITEKVEGASKRKAKNSETQPTVARNLKVQITKLSNEIDDYQRRIQAAKLQLQSQQKLRHQAETEVRALRAELTQKKISLTLTKNQFQQAEGLSPRF